MKYKVKLNPKQIQYLLSKPEKGMGYQVADLKLVDGSVIKDAVILNCEELELDKAISSDEILDFIIK
jgi:hypothetical protein